MATRAWATLIPLLLASCGGSGSGDDCHPTSCEVAGTDCGTIPDLCGSFLDCGTCQAPATCGGGGVANVCGVGPGPDGAVASPDGAVASPDGAVAGPDAAAPVVDAATNRPPSILVLSTNTTTLLSTQQLAVTAVVTDPDGVDDLIGGTLLDPTSGNTYGAFATSAAEGSYEIDLTWGAIDTVGAIDAPPAGAPRRFLARFFDTSGASAEREVTVTLRCATDGESACSGDCFDLQTDPDHCGACNTPVAAGLVCRDGVPACYYSGEVVCGGDCVQLATSSDNCGACGATCYAWETAHGISHGQAWCENGSCVIEQRRWPGTETSCAQVCTPLGLGCATVSISSDIYCWDGGAGVGCANYETTSCGYSERATTCDQTLGVTWTPLPTYCGYPNPYPREVLTCFCSSGAPACTSSTEDTAAACTDGCSNDGDVYADCDDYDCCDVVSCPTGTACNY